MASRALSIDCLARDNNGYFFFEIIEYSWQNAGITNGGGNHVCVTRGGSLIRAAREQNGKLGNIPWRRHACYTSAYANDSRSKMKLSRPKA